MHLVDQPSGPVRHHQGDHSRRGVHQGRGQGGQAASLLSPHHQRVRGGDGGQADQGNGQVGDGEVAVLEQRQGHQRLIRVAPLPQDEHHEQQHPCDQQRRDADGPVDHAPVVAGRLLEAEHDAEQPRAGEHDPEPVEPVPVLLQVWDQPGGRDVAGHANRHVDEENPLPPEHPDQQAAQQRADEHRQARGRPPDRHRLAALVGWEQPSDHGHGLRGHQRSAQALHHPGHDQHLDGVGQAAGQRGEGEDDEPE